MKSKVIILAALTVLILSCSTNKYIERTIPGSTTVAFLDFKPFLDKGFIFSTGDINQSYIPLGVLYHTTEPDIIKTYRPFNSVVTESMKLDGSIILENDQEYVLNRSMPKQKSDINGILQKVYEYSVSKGANGVVNMKYSILPDKTIEISGTLIILDK
jgi:hypothetical protein